VRLGLSLDDFTEVVHHLGCPAPRLGFESDGLTSPVRGVHLFDGLSIDCYLERIERLFGFSANRKAKKS